jgi:hypothetical protein
MCDRCESRGLLAGLLTKAGVAATPSQPPENPISVEVETASLGEKSQPARRRKLWELEEKHLAPGVAG